MTQRAWEPIQPPHIQDSLTGSLEMGGPGGGGTWLTKMREPPRKEARQKGRCRAEALASFSRMASLLPYLGALTTLRSRGQLATSIQGSHGIPRWPLSVACYAVRASGSWVPTALG